MAELSHLEAEIGRVDGVIDTELTDGTGILKFQTQVGEYDHLTSEMVSTLGRYDCEVYPQDDGEYWAIPP